MSIDLSSWITKPDAAARLGISERTLDRRCEAGTGPERRERPRLGLKPEPVYNPDDVERLAAPKAHVMPEEVPSSSALAPRPPASSEVLSLVLERIAGAVESAIRPETPALWLTLPQAAAYSGLTVTLLRRMVREGRLPAIRDRGTKVRKADLDSDEMVARLSECVGKPAPIPGGRDE